MKKSFLHAIFLAIFLLPVNLAFAGSEINVNKNGDITIIGAKVMQLAGKTLFARLYWGDTFLRILIKTNDSTKFLRATSEVTGLSEIKEGDMLDVTGTLESGSSSLNIIPTVVKNSSVQKQQATYSGTVESVDNNKNQFVLTTQTGSKITVSVGTTTQVIKGSRTLDIFHIKIGDYISKTVGDYNLANRTLSANKVLVYIDPNYYKSKNFEGILENISGTTLPTSIIVRIDTVKYTINLPVNTSILTKNRAQTSLSRFMIGDKIRFYGIIREIDEPIIDAEIVRNLNL
jgi:hypothetical protein